MQTKKTLQLISQWEREGLIDPQQAVKIRERYSASASLSQMSLFMIIFASLLTGMAVIFFIASGYFSFLLGLPALVWEILLLVSIGIVLGAALLSKEFQRTAWLGNPKNSKNISSPRTAKRILGFSSKSIWASVSHTAPLLSTLLFTAFLVLISRTYHLPSNLNNFLLALAIFVLPQILLMRAAILLTIFNIISIYMISSNFQIITMDIFHPGILLACSLLTNILFYLFTYREDKKKSLILNNLNILLFIIIFSTYIINFVSQIYDDFFLSNYIPLVVSLVFLVHLNLKLMQKKWPKNTWVKNLYKDLAMSYIFSKVLFISSLLIYSNYYLSKELYYLSNYGNKDFYDFLNNLFIISMVFFIINIIILYFSIFKKKYSLIIENNSIILTIIKVLWLLVTFFINYPLAIILSLTVMLLHLTLAYLKSEEHQTMGFILLIFIWILQFIFLSEMAFLLKAFLSLGLAVILFFINFWLRKQLRQRSLKKISGYNYVP